MADQPAEMNPTPSLPQGYDPLVAFAHWWVQQGAVPLCPFNGLTRVGSFSGLVLYRQDQFQVQLWLADPHSHITPHSHPGVDQLHVYLSGSADFSINGVPQVASSQLKELPDGRVNAHGQSARVRPGDIEEARIGPEGWAFLTIQRWADGKPKSVEIAWEGEPLSIAHAIAIKKP